MTPEEQESARETRKQSRRKVSLLSTALGDNSEGTEVDDPDVDSSEDAPQPSGLKSSLKSIKQVPPELLVAPTVRFVETTQRNLHYANTTKARQIAKQIVKDAKASLPRKVKALNT
jgi:hypothetical protein